MDQFTLRQTHPVCLLSRIKVSTIPVLCGVLHASVLGLILFVLCTADLVEMLSLLDCIRTSMPMTPRYVATCRPGATDSLWMEPCRCLCRGTELRYNGLHLNNCKSEVLWCASFRRQSQQSATLPTRRWLLAAIYLSPVSCVYAISKCIDADLTMVTQITRTCCKYFAGLLPLNSYESYGCSQKRCYSRLSWR